MNCPKCGTENAETSRFCVQCGQPLVADGAAPTTAEAGYAGFWIRVGAYLIDYLIMTVAGFVIGFLAVMLTDASYDGGGLLLVCWLILPWIYCAVLESGPMQATIGKRAVGLKVTGLDGQRIGFGRATGRYFAEILSGLSLGIGYAMVAFTKRRQALHDLIAGTLVVHGNLDPARLAAGLPAAKPMPGWAVTLIVLGCMVPVLGILAAIAIPAYQDYTIRSQVYEGLVLASDVKAGVVEFAAQTGRWPADLEEAGIAADVAAAVSGSRHVVDIQVSDGTIYVEYGGAANLHIQGEVLSLRPFVSDDGDVIWQCGNADDPVDGEAVLELEDGSIIESGEQYTTLHDKFLPAACRASSAVAPGGAQA